MFLQYILPLTHASGTLVDIDGIWVEKLLPAAFEGASYVCDGDGSLVKSEVRVRSNFDRTILSVFSGPLSFKRENKH